MVGLDGGTDYFYDIEIADNVMYGLCRNVSTGEFKIVSFSSSTNTNYTTYRNFGVRTGGNMILRFFIY